MNNYMGIIRGLYVKNYELCELNELASQNM